MKNIFKITLLAILLKGTLVAQTVNQISIFPPNPTENDTILVISDLSYRGNCAFGLVYSYTDVTGSTVRIFPTYCGYWDTTLCNSVDTFKIGPFPNGDYDIRIQYHQGSICPISNFDATIHEVDTMLTVGGVTATLPEANPGFLVKIYPNPANNHLFIHSAYFTERQTGQLKITNVFGQQVFQSKIAQNQLAINTAEWKEKGIYFISVFDEMGVLLDVQKIVIEKL